MRILQINSSKGWSGGQNQVFLLAQGLAARGHEVVTACPSNSRLAERCIQAGLIVEAFEADLEISIPTMRKLAAIMKKHKIEVANVHKPKPYTQAAAAAWMAKLPVLVVSRRVSFPVGRGFLSTLKWKYMRRDGVIAVSQMIKNGLVDFGIPGKDIEVIYSGTNLDRFDPSLDGKAVREEFNIPPDAPLVLSLGNYFEWKGHLDLIDSAATVLEQYPEAHFLIAGNDSELRPRMEAQAAKRGMKDRLHLPGPRNDVPQLLAASNMLVTVAIRGEGLAGVIREAFAMHRPVVASDVGGNKELVLDGINGYLVPPGAPDRIACAVLQLLDNPEQARKMAAQGSKRVEETFTDRIMVQRTEAFYQRLLEAKTHILGKNI